MSGAFTIGRLAQAAGVNVETVRYYQRRGLLGQPAKPLRGYRHYTPEMVERIRFVKRAQASGFSLEDIRTLLDFDRGVDCADIRQLLENKMRDIARQMDNLRAVQNTVSVLLDKCGARRCPGRCPVVCAFEGTGVCPL